VYKIGVEYTNGLYALKGKGRGDISYEFSPLIKKELLHRPGAESAQDREQYTRYLLLQMTQIMRVKSY
jgi:hypothetical protein